MGLLGPFVGFFDFVNSLLDYHVLVRTMLFGEFFQVFGIFFKHTLFYLLGARIFLLQFCPFLFLMTIGLLIEVEATDALR